MYVQVGQYDGNLSELAELIHILRPAPTLPLGYLTTEPIATTEIYGPVLKAIFPGIWAKCFLSIVWPNGSIMPHADMDMPSTYRQHLVIKTNPDAWVMHDGGVEQLREGGIYSMDETRVHAAMNWGQDVRIHFVIDRYIDD